MAVVCDRLDKSASLIVKVIAFYCSFAGQTETEKRFSIANGMFKKKMDIDATVID
jgi:hypothetical protein